MPTHYSLLTTHYSARAKRPATATANSTQHSALSTQHSALTTQHSLLTFYPPQTFCKIVSGEISATVAVGDLIPRNLSLFGNNLLGSVEPNRPMV